MLGIPLIPLWPGSISNPPWWLGVLAVPAVLLPLSVRDGLKPVARRVYTFFLAALLSWQSLFYFQAIYSNVLAPREWDYMAFWLIGKVAAEGGNFYAPADYQRAAQGLHLSSGFQRELLDVGALYPPPSVFLFLPLGWTDPQTGLIAWYLVQCAALAAAAWLLWKEFLHERGATGLAACAALVLLFRPSGQTMDVAQTNFLLLLCVLLFWRARHRWTSGIWLLLSVLLKPLAGILLLFSLVRRQWDAVLCFFLSAGISVAAAAAVFGLVPLRIYLSGSPRKLYPADLYTQPVIQSLFSWVMRVTKENLRGPVSFLHPQFLLLAAILLGITVWLLLRGRREGADAGRAMLLPLGLLLYPTTIVHYSILLIVPLLLVWKERERLPGGTATALVWITSVFTLICLPYKFTFLMIAANWLGMGVLSYWWSRKKGPLPATSLAA